MTQTATVKTASEVCTIVNSISYGIQCNPTTYHVLRNIKFLEQCSTVDVSLIKEKYGLQ